MKNSTLFLVFCFIFTCSIPLAGQPCTTFCLDKGNQLVVGSNLDTFTDNGFVFINKRNMSKTAHLNPSWGEEQPVSWKSKYGSVTFNIAGREFPFGGMNEAGLVVTSMWLEKTEFPRPDSRHAISSVQWKQYQLDNFSTVDEVIASNSQIRIAPKSFWRSHFLVSDRLGNCAVIEFIDGKRTHYFKETFPVKALANITYLESIDYWKNSEKMITDRYSSEYRFVTAAEMVQSYDPATSKRAVDYAFNTLTKVSMGTVQEIDGVRIRSMLATVLSIAYDIKNLRVYFRTFVNRNKRYVDMSSLDFSCKTPVKVLDIHEDLSGDVSKKFTNYTYKLNRDLIGNQKGQPDEILVDTAKYPETTVCTDK